MQKILLVIDMQNDFIDGALGSPEAKAIVDRVVEEIGRYPAAAILATQDTHSENYLETQEGRNLPVVHCVKGTPGWELHPKIAEALKGAEIFEKPTFGSRELAEKLALLAKSDDLEITMVGLCTDICVVSNALLVKAYLPETPIRIIASCCAGVTSESHQAALKTMQMCQIQIQE
ncbi:MAG: cysteine hydrolase [Lachnospiraceae bacterium]|jgi:nicotinamidase/pyrazinamidase|nr:cysteine hydrolase [Lachnospiraceae bacterium]